MAKKNSRRKFKAGSSAFDTALKNASLWAEIRVPEDETEQFIDSVYRIWVETDPHLDHRQLWDLFVHGQAQIKKRVDAITWSRVDARNLMVILESYISILKGMDKFLPRPYMDLPEIARRFLYVHWLLLNTPPEDSKAPGPSAGGCLPAWLCAFFYTAGPHASAEIIRRAQQHVGFYAGVLILLVKAVHMTTEKAVIDDEIRNVIDVLRQSTWKKIPKPIQEKLKKQSEEEGPEKTIVGAPSHDDLTGMIALTILSRWEHVDPLEAVAQSLDGLLDIAPEAVMNKLVDQHRKQRTKETFEVLIREKDREDAFPSGELNPEQEFYLRELIRLIQDDPRARRLASVRLKGAETQREVAEQEKVDPKSVYNWRQVLDKILEK